MTHESIAMTATIMAARVSRRIHLKGKTMDDKQGDVNIRNLINGMKGFRHMGAVRDAMASMPEGARWSQRMARLLLADWRPDLDDGLLRYCATERIAAVIDGMPEVVRIGLQARMRQWAQMEVAE
jgi:hypothetical protein